MPAYPPIALLPGLLCTADLWRDQIAFLEELTGETPFVADFSKSDSIADMAQGVLDAMPEKFIALGLSMGGYVAMELMREAPERLVGLGLFDTSARLDTADRLKERKLLISMARVGKFVGINDRLIPTLIHKTQLGNKDLISRIKKMAIDIGREGFLNQQTAIINRVDSLPTLAKIKVPTLVICGDADQLTPPEMSKQIADGIGDNAKLEFIKDCDHLSTMEKPAEVNQLVKSWLDANFYYARPIGTTS